MKHKLILATAIALAFTGAQAKDPNKDKIVFGATVGDHADMFKAAVQPQLEKDGYKVEVIEFTDYIRPNLALANGELDVNEFQHKPYLDTFKAAKGLDITNVFQAPTAPLGLYAGKLNNLDQLKDSVRISLPNDPSNSARALLLLQDLGWLTLKKDIDALKASPKDIVDNPHKIEFVELEAAQLPRSRGDVDFAIIPGNYATSSGIKISDALHKEPGITFINWVAVRSEDTDKPWVKDVEAAYNSDSFKAWANEHFQGYKFPENWK
ncbi:MetQ/NlpA family ABC transporter substrate-binding protein [Suttonella ornithocola]|uniref:Lipoprotein n=1 Tax=Suttonella ornithocola TaxID=279832 RepID=A0A380MPW9_9GAMM|nr:MetQ/NlpA family ABC transporter substrate-binding protein [Suttonella ornithocola]SUO93943.1 D-methionine-binding lipoprotein metQ precursor [Suttonella ornithocola]